MNLRKCLFLFVLLTSTLAHAIDVGTWTATGSMSTARRPTATLLSNGKVLVAGGYSSGTGYSTTGTVYDPASGIWTATGTMITPRDGPTATRLSVNIRPPHRRASVLARMRADGV